MGAISHKNMQECRMMLKLSKEESSHLSPNMKACFCFVLPVCVGRYLLVSTCIGIIYVEPGNLFSDIEW